MASLPGSGTASGDLHQFYEPQARFNHCCCNVEQNVYVYGHSLHMTVPPPSGVVDVFNLPSGRWQQLPTTGPPPPGVHGSVCAVVGNCAFFFGGVKVVDGVLQLYNTIHKLDVISMHWKELEPAKHVTAPMEKCNAGMVSYYESNLLVFSGYGRLPADPNTRPANYVPSLRLAHLRLGWTNELHLFDLQSRTWSVPETTGTPPPACVGCSFTRVDKHRGVVFGGEQQRQLLPNHIHILNFQSWHWLRVESSGASGQPWPSARCNHTTVSVCDPDGGSPHPALLVCWGLKDRRVIDDTWTLELSVTTCQWKQVTLPSSLRGRVGHTTAVVHHDDHHKQLVHFGGLHEIPPYGQWKLAVPETTIVELESSGHPGDWIATRVNQLGRTVAGGDGVAVASHHLPLGGIRQPPFQSPLYRPEMPPIQLPLIDYPAQPSAMMPDLESFSFLDPLETLELLPPTQPQSWPPVPHPLPLTSMQPGPVGSQSTQTGYEAGTQPLYYPSLTPSSMGFSSMRSLPLTSSSPAVSQYAPLPGPMFHQQIRPLQANPLMPMHAQPVVQQGFRPGTAVPQQQPQQHMRPPTQQPARGGQFPPPATPTLQPSTEKPTPTTSLPQAGTQSSDYLSQIPPSPAFAAMLPQIAPSPASRQPTVLQPTLLGPPISRYHQLPPSAIPTTQPPRQPPTHPSSTDRKTASLEGAIVKKEPKWSESPAHLKEPQSPEVKHKVKPEQWPEGEYDKVVLAEKMELQQAYKNVCDQHEELQLAYKELKEKMEHISGSQSESSEDTKAMGDIPLKKAKRELYEHTVKSQGEATEDVKTTEYLRGVEVIAETQFIMKGRHRQTFKWEGHGLKLSIPEDAIQSSEAESVISIKAGLAGQFELPAGAQLVSPMYWLYCKHIFQHPVTLELQHCATIRNNSEHSSVCFIVAKCSQKALPYKFKFLDKGTFSEHSSYGSIEVKQFSLFGLVENFMQLFVQPPPPQPRRYFSQLFYFDEGHNTWQLDFIITWNLDFCITHVQQKYSTLAVEGPHTEVEFEMETISLAIPEDGIIGNGWTITPLNAQVITKQQVDSFKPGQRIPTCQLQVQLATTDSPKKLSYKLTLEGAKEPFNFLTVTRTPVIPVYDPVHGRKRPRQSEEEPLDAPPSLAELRAEPELPHFMNLVAAHIPSKWRLVGIQLHLKDSELDCIEVTSDDPLRCFSSVFTLWKRKETRLPLSWWTVLQALEAASVGEQRLARQVTSKLNTPSHD